MKKVAERRTTGVDLRGDAMEWGKARANPEFASSCAGIVVSENGDQWFLLNATPGPILDEESRKRQWLTPPGIEAGRAGVEVRV